MIYDFSAFQWAIYLVRLASMVLAASFAASLIRLVGPRWTIISKGSRAWVIAMLAYSINVAVFVALVIASNVAVFPDSIIWAGFATSFILLHRALYHSKNGELT